jgi:hypothetical protein
MQAVSERFSEKVWPISTNINKMDIILVFCEVVTANQINIYGLPIYIDAWMGYTNQSYLRHADLLTETWRTRVITAPGQSG